MGKTRATLIVLMGLAAHAAVAADISVLPAPHVEATARALFSRTDSDRDGLLSRHEWTTAGWKDERFPVIDTKGDNVIDEQEFIAAWALCENCF